MRANRRTLDFDGIILTRVMFPREKREPWKSRQPPRINCSRHYKAWMPILEVLGRGYIFLVIMFVRMVQMNGLLLGVKAMYMKIEKLEKPVGKELCSGDPYLGKCQSIHQIPLYRSTHPFIS